MGRKVRSQLDAVEFVVVGFREIVVASRHDDVTSGARTASAAGVLEWNTEVQCDIEQRLWLAVFFKRQLAVFKFDGAVTFRSEIRKCHLRHALIVAFRCCDTGIFPCFI